MAKEEEMKLLTIRFKDTVDISPLAVGTDVVVSDGTTTASGNVMSRTVMEEPPTIEGDYHIEPIVEEGET